MDRVIIDFDRDYSDEEDPSNTGVAHMPGQVALQVQQLRMQVVQLSRQKGRGDIQKLNEEMEKLQQEIQRRTALLRQPARQHTRPLPPAAAVGVAVAPVRRATATRSTLNQQQQQQPAQGSGQQPQQPPQQQQQQPVAAKPTNASSIAARSPPAAVVVAASNSGTVAVAAAVTESSQRGAGLDGPLIVANGVHSEHVAAGVAKSGAHGTAGIGTASGTAVAGLAEGAAVRAAGGVPVAAGGQQAQRGAKAGHMEVSQQGGQQAQQAKVRGGVVQQQAREQEAPPTKAAHRVVGKALHAQQQAAQVARLEQEHAVGPATEQQHVFVGAPAPREQQAGALNPGRPSSSPAAGPAATSAAAMSEGLSPSAAADAFLSSLALDLPPQQAQQAQQHAAFPRQQLSPRQEAPSFGGPGSLRMADAGFATDLSLLLPQLQHLQGLPELALDLAGIQSPPMLGLPARDLHPPFWDALPSARQAPAEAQAPYFAEDVDGQLSRFDRGTGVNVRSPSSAEVQFLRPLELLGQLPYPHAAALPPPMLPQQAQHTERPAWPHGASAAAAGAGGDLPPLPPGFGGDGSRGSPPERAQNTAPAAAEARRGGGSSSVVRRPSDHDPTRGGIASPAAPARAREAAGSRPGRDGGGEGLPSAERLLVPRSSPEQGGSGAAAARWRKRHALSRGAASPDSGRLLDGYTSESEVEGAGAAMAAQQAQQAKRAQQPAQQQQQQGLAGDPSSPLPTPSSGGASAAKSSPAAQKAAKSVAVAPASRQQPPQQQPPTSSSKTPKAGAKPLAATAAATGGKQREEKAKRTKQPQQAGSQQPLERSVRSADKQGPATAAGSIADPKPIMSKAAEPPQAAKPARAAEKAKHAAAQQATAKEARETSQAGAAGSVERRQLVPAQLAANAPGATSAPQPPLVHARPVPTTTTLAPPADLPAAVTAGVAAVAAAGAAQEQRQVVPQEQLEEAPAAPAPASADMARLRELARVEADKRRLLLRRELLRELIKGAGQTWVGLQAQERALREQLGGGGGGSGSAAPGAASGGGLELVMAEAGEGVEDAAALAEVAKRAQQERSRQLAERAQHAARRIAQRLQGLNLDGGALAGAGSMQMQVEPPPEPVFLRLLAAPAPPPPQAPLPELEQQQQQAQQQQAQEQDERQEAAAALPQQQQQRPGAMVLLEAEPTAEALQPIVPLAKGAAVATQLGRAQQPQQAQQGKERQQQQQQPQLAAKPAALQAALPAEAVMPPAPQHAKQGTAPTAPAAVPARRRSPSPPGGSSTTSDSSTTSGSSTTPSSSTSTTSSDSSSSSTSSGTTTSGGSTSSRGSSPERPLHALGAVTTAQPGAKATVAAKASAPAAAVVPAVPAKASAPAAAAGLAAVPAVPAAGKAPMAAMPAAAAAAGASVSGIAPPQGHKAPPQGAGATGSAAGAGAGAFRYKAVPALDQKEGAHQQQQQQKQKQKLPQDGQQEQQRSREKAASDVRTGTQGIPFTSEELEKQLPTRLRRAKFATGLCRLFQDSLQECLARNKTPFPVEWVDKQMRRLDRRWDCWEEQRCTFQELCMAMHLRGLVRLRQRRKGVWDVESRGPTPLPSSSSPFTSSSSSPSGSPSPRPRQGGGQDGTSGPAKASDIAFDTAFDKVAAALNKSLNKAAGTSGATAAAGAKSAAQPQRSRSRSRRGRGSPAGRAAARSAQRRSGHARRSPSHSPRRPAGDRGGAGPPKEKPAPSPRHPSRSRERARAAGVWEEGRVAGRGGSRVRGRRSPPPRAQQQPSGARRRERSPSPSSSGGSSWQSGSAPSSPSGRSLSPLPSPPRRLAVSTGTSSSSGTTAGAGALGARSAPSRSAARSAPVSSRDRKGEVARQRSRSPLRERSRESTRNTGKRVAQPSDVRRREQALQRPLPAGAQTAAEASHRPRPGAAAGVAAAALAGVEGKHGQKGKEGGITASARGTARQQPQGAEQAAQQAQQAGGKRGRPQSRLVSPAATREAASPPAKRQAASEARVSPCVAASDAAPAGQQGQHAEQARQQTQHAGQQQQQQEEEPPARPSSQASIGAAAVLTSANALAARILAARAGGGAGGASATAPLAAAMPLAPAPPRLPPAPPAAALGEAVLEARAQALQQRRRQEAQRLLERQHAAAAAAAAASGAAPAGHAALQVAARQARQGPVPLVRVLLIPSGSGALERVRLVITPALPPPASQPSALPAAPDRGLPATSRPAQAAAPVSIVTMTPLAAGQTMPRAAAGGVAAAPQQPPSQQQAEHAQQSKQPAKRVPGLGIREIPIYEATAGPALSAPAGKSSSYGGGRHLPVFTNAGRGAPLHARPQASAPKLPAAATAAAAQPAAAASAAAQPAAAGSAAAAAAAGAGAVAGEPAQQPVVEERSLGTTPRAPAGTQSAPDLAAGGAMGNQPELAGAALAAAEPEPAVEVVAQSAAAAPGSLTSPEPGELLSSAVSGASLEAPLAAQAASSRACLAAAPASAAALVSKPPPPAGQVSQGVSAEGEHAKPAQQVEQAQQQALPRQRKRAFSDAPPAAPAVPSPLSQGPQQAQQPPEQPQQPSQQQGKTPAQLQRPLADQPQRSPGQRSDHTQQQQQDQPRKPREVVTSQPQQPPHEQPTQQTLGQAQEEQVPSRRHRVFSDQPQQPSVGQSPQQAQQHPQQDSQQAQQQARQDEERRRRQRVFTDQPPSQPTHVQGAGAPLVTAAPAQPLTSPVVGAGGSSLQQQLALQQLHQQRQLQQGLMAEPALHAGVAAGTAGGALALTTTLPPWLAGRGTSPQASYPPPPALPVGVDPALPPGFGAPSPSLPAPSALPQQQAQQGGWAPAGPQQAQQPINPPWQAVSQGLPHGPPPLGPSPQQHLQPSPAQPYPPPYPRPYPPPAQAGYTLAPPTHAPPPPPPGGSPLLPPGFGLGQLLPQQQSPAAPGAPGATDWDSIAAAIAMLQGGGSSSSGGARGHQEAAAASGLIPPQLLGNEGLPVQHAQHAQQRPQQQPIGQLQRPAAPPPWQSQWQPAVLHEHQAPCMHNGSGAAAPWQQQHQHQQHQQQRQQSQGGPYPPSGTPPPYPQPPLQPHPQQAQRGLSPAAQAPGSGASSRKRRRPGGGPSPRAPAPQPVVERWETVSVDPEAILLQEEEEEMGEGGAAGNPLSRPGSTPPSIRSRRSRRERSSEREGRRRRSRDGGKQEGGGSPDGPGGKRAGGSRARSRDTEGSRERRGRSRHRRESERNGDGGRSRGRQPRRDEEGPGQSTGQRSSPEQPQHAQQAKHPQQQQPQQEQSQEREEGETLSPLVLQSLGAEPPAAPQGAASDAKAQQAQQQQQGERSVEEGELVVEGAVLLRSPVVVSPDPPSLAALAPIAAQPGEPASHPFASAGAADDAAGGAGAGAAAALAGIARLSARLAQSTEQPLAQPGSRAGQAEHAQQAQQGAGSQQPQESRQQAQSHIIPRPSQHPLSQKMRSQAANIQPPALLQQLHSALSSAAASAASAGCYGSLGGLGLASTLAAIGSPLWDPIMPPGSKSAGATTAVPLLGTAQQGSAGRVDALWPLCPFELRGACKDQDCRYQMSQDYGSPPASKRARVSPAAIKAASLETTLPAYSFSQAAARLPGGLSGRPAVKARGGAAELTWQRHLRPFQSLLLSPAAHLAPAPWNLIPGALPAPPHGVQQDAAGPSPRQDPRSPLAVPASGGSQAARYFAGAASGSSAAAAGSPGAAGGSEGGAGASGDSRWRQQYEARLRESPHDEELWAEYALQQLPSRGDGLDEFAGLAAAALPDSASREAAILVLKRGLEQNKHSSLLWPLYLHFFLLQGEAPETARRMIESSLRFAPQCYRLWLTAVQHTPRWQDRAALLRRGVSALVAAPAAPAGRPQHVQQHQQQPEGGLLDGTGCFLPGEQGACALDLALRLLGLLTQQAQAPEAEALLRQWVPAPAAGPGVADSGSPGSAVRDGATAVPAATAELAGALWGRPGLLCVLWTSLAHVAAYGSLPQFVSDRVGYPQEPLPLQWAQPPPLPKRAVAAAAVLSLGARDLQLLILGQRASEEPSHPAEAIAAGSAYVLTMLRLDVAAGTARLAGSLDATGSGQSAVGPGTPSASAALRCACQLYMQAQRAQQELPAQLLALMQEAAVAAVLTACGVGSDADMHGVTGSAMAMSGPASEASTPSEGAAANAGLTAKAGGPAGLAVLEAMARGRLHPACALAVAAALLRVLLTGPGQQAQHERDGPTGQPLGAEGAAGLVQQLLSRWAVAYKGERSQAWPDADLFVARGSNPGDAAPLEGPPLSPTHLASGLRMLRRYPVGRLREETQAGDAAWRVYGAACAVLHSVLGALAGARRAEAGSRNGVEDLLSGVREELSSLAELAASVCAEPPVGPGGGAAAAGAACSSGAKRELLWRAQQEVAMLAMLLPPQQYQQQRQQRQQGFGDESQPRRPDLPAQQSGAAVTAAAAGSSSSSAGGEAGPWLQAVLQQLGHIAAAKPLQPLCWPALKPCHPRTSAVLLPPAISGARASVSDALLAMLGMLRRQQGSPAEDAQRGGLSVRLVESLLSGRPCGPLAAEVAVRVAQQVMGTLLREGAAPQELWRQPLLSWAMPCAASALVSCWPAASPQLWHQAVSITQQVSLLSAAELAAAATAAQPHSQLLWRQRLMIAQQQQQQQQQQAQQDHGSSRGGAISGGGREVEAIKMEALAHGIRLA